MATYNAESYLQYVFGTKSWGYIPGCVI